MRRIFLALCRYSGVFILTSFLFRNKLLILCYHGISQLDEHSYAPGLFIQRKKFRKRLELLRRYRFNPVSIEVCTQKLKTSGLPSNPVLITADDGYANTPDTLASDCAEFNFPLTVYVRTDYLGTKKPIFVPTLQYLLWKTRRDHIETNMIQSIPLESQSWDLRGSGANQLVQVLREKTKNLAFQEKMQVLEELASALDVDFQSVKEYEVLQIMNEHQVSQLIALGADVQLHTHNHKFPNVEGEAKAQIQANRDSLAALTNRDLTHFCYPSGLVDPTHPRYLSDMGIQSATTLRNGFNSKRADLLLLKRKIDRDDITDTEFLAEVSGFLDIARKARGALKYGLGAITKTAGR